MTEAVSTETQIKFRHYTPDDETSVLELLRRCLGENENLRRTPDVWRWKHIENPFGRSYALVAADDSGRVVGLRAFLRWEFLEGERTVTAVRAVDTSVDPEFRRMGFFTKLTLQAIGEVKTEGVGLIFNTPNEKSLPGYLKMGWREVGAVVPLVKVVNYPRFLIGYTRERVLGTRNGAFPPGAFLKAREPSSARNVLESVRLDRLLEGDSRVWGGAFRTRRTAPYLHWRYGRHPTINYRAVVDGDSSDPRGIAIFRTNTRFGLREVVLSELLLKEASIETARRLVGSLKRSIRGDYLVAYFPTGSFHREAVGRIGFRKVPLGGMTLVSNPLNGDRPALAGLHGWGLSIGDLEYF